MKAIFTKIATGSIFLACLLSCEKENRTGVVRFLTYSAETKGTVTTTASINTVGNKFLVDLYQHGSNTIIQLGATAMCIEAEEESKKAVNGIEWDLTPMTYWENRTIDAWARYPIELNGSMGLVQSISGGELSSFTTDDRGNKVSIDNTQTALTFNYLTYHSDEGNDAEMQDDLLFAHSYQRTYNDLGGRIPIHFNHALSAIYFQTGKETSPESGYEIGENVRIDAIEIRGIKRAGTCTYTPVQAAGDNLSLSTAQFDNLFAWQTNTDSPIDRSVGSYRQDFNQIHSPSTVLGGSEFGNAKTFLLIPQTMTEDAQMVVYWSTKSEGTWNAREPRSASIYKIKDNSGNESIVEWKAGYKYLYTIRIKHQGAELDLTLDVKDWDYVDHTVYYSDNVAASTTGQLDITDTDNTTSSGITSAAILNKPAKCTFTLDSPVGGSWVVALTDDQHFALSLDGITPAASISGEINHEKPATFFVIPTATDRSRQYTTSVRISAKRIDGTTISADETLATGKWRIVLPATI